MLTKGGKELDLVARRSSIAILALALVAGAAALWAGQGSLQRSEGLQPQGVEGTVHPGIRSIDSLFDSSQPLMVDEQEPTSFEEAVNKADFTVATPQQLPTGVKRTEVWYSDSSGEVAMRYGDTLVIEYVPWVADGSPTEEYARLAEQYGAGQATTVAGLPAWVVPAGSAGNDEPPVAEVRVAVNGVEVTLYGKMAIDDLVAVAASLSPVDKVQTGLSN